MEEDRQKFVKARNQLNSMIRTAKKKHLENEIKSKMANGKRICKITNNFINRKTAKNKDISHLTNDNQKITDKKRMADLFNDSFSKIGTKLADVLKNTPDDLLLPNQHDLSMEFEPVTESYIKEILDSLENKVSNGHNDISNKLLKYIGVYLLKPLTIIINHTFETKSFPDELKLAKVVPIFKKKEQKTMSTTTD